MYYYDARMNKSNQRTEFVVKLFFINWIRFLKGKAELKF